MMLKLIGCVLIIASSLLFGVGYCNKLKTRIKSINLFIELFKILKLKMEYQLSTIPYIFSQISQSGYENCVVSQCLRLINEGEMLSTAWRFALENNCDRLCLSKSDYDVLKKFAIELGQTDLNGQISNLSLYIELALKNLSEAEKNAQDKSKIVLNTSIFTGLIVSILLI